MMRKTRAEQKRRHQLTLPVTLEERMAIERFAQAEQRSLANALRLLLADALRRLESEQRKTA
jgi:hypothetical protein